MERRKARGGGGDWKMEEVLEGLLLLIQDGEVNRLEEVVYGYL